MPARGGRGCLDELARRAGNGRQLLGRTTLGHAGTGLGRFEEHDLVGLADGGQAVGDHDDGAAPGELTHHLGDGGLVLPVQGRGDLVEQEDRGVLDEGPGDGDALTLPTGQAQPAGTDLCVPPVRERLDDAVQAARLAASASSASVASGRAMRRFSRMVVSNR